MAWKKASNNQPAVGTPKLVGEGTDVHYVDDQGDTVYPTTATDFPQPVPQTNFMGITGNSPPEGSTHSLLVKIMGDLALIKARLGI